MKTALEQIRDLLEAYDQVMPPKPELPDEEIRALRRALLQEEYEEYTLAERDNDLIDIADALADMIVIILGTAAQYGIPLDLVWDEVHESNMSKVDPDTGKVQKREDGKVIKPEGWQPPKIREIIEHAWGE